MPEKPSTFWQKFGKRITAAGAVVAVISAISGTTLGSVSYFASKGHVRLVVGLQYDQMLDYRLRDLQAELSEINARKRAGRELDTDEDRKRFIIDEIGRIQKQQEGTRVIN